MAGGHLSSWNDWNGFCKVKPYDADMAVTSPPLHLFSAYLLAVTETIWAGWRRPGGVVGGCYCLILRCSSVTKLFDTLWTLNFSTATCETRRNEECQVSEWTQHSTREIRWAWSYWEQFYPQTQTLVQSLTPGLCYLCNPASIKYTYDCTYTQPQTHTYTHTGTHYRHPAHTLFQSGLYRSRDRRPHHIESTVLGFITPVRPGHSTGLGWAGAGTARRWGEGGAGGRQGGGQGEGWCGGWVQCYLAAVLLKTARSLSINFADITSIRGP